MDPTHPEAGRREARILVVDDQPANVRLLTRLLGRYGFSGVEGHTDPAAALARHAEDPADLVLLDLHMPGGLDGYATIARLAETVREGDELPILVLTADVTPEARARALAAGAKDFVTKPFDATEVLLRVRNLLETRWLHRRLRVHADGLEDEVRRRTADLEAARLELLDRLARVAEYRDDPTGGHPRRVGALAVLLAWQLGLDGETVDLVGLAAPLHDIGKVGAPAGGGEGGDGHTRVGAELLADSRFPTLQVAAEIARTHHERWDGGGPGGLRGEDIPLAGRIVAVADAFDGLTHGRAARTTEAAIAAFREERGGRFDPAVVDALVAVAAAGHLGLLAEAEEVAPPLVDARGEHESVAERDLAAVGD